MSKCNLHSNNDMGYLEWHSDAERRQALGMKQKQCPKCGLWIWEDLYYNKEQDHD